ncbi:MAG: radical SAM protein, partial [Akkermansiaceae bacterium]|nr:radical SAM protein [Akkermansiaceae bacterium]
EPGGRLSVCLVYPNTYRVGMSSLGYQGVYTMINARSNALCERAFLPADEDIAEYERTGERLSSLESGR